VIRAYAHTLSVQPQPTVRVVSTYVTSGGSSDHNFGRATADQYGDHVRRFSGGSAKHIMGGYG